MTPSFLEDHVSQIPALQVLINMGYTYVSPTEMEQWRKEKRSVVILEEVLREQLRNINQIHRRGQTYDFSEGNLSAAIQAIKDLPVQDGFIAANKAFYELITLGKSLEQRIEGDKKSHTLRYIDWEQWDNNVFHVTEEFSVTRTARSDTYRPDIVLFVNGIPTVIIECKSPALSGTKSPTELAIEQHIRNFRKDGIRDLYVYSSLLLSIATNDGRYGTTGTSKEFWSNWKELFPNQVAQDAWKEQLNQLKNQPLSEAQKTALFAERKYGFSYARRYFDSLESEVRPITRQDELLYSLCKQDRLLDLIRNYTVYDDGIKKVARYQQYFVVKESIERVTHFGHTGKRPGGVIWHTQGSGKSLTMVMLAQMIASHPHIRNPKLLLVTDRIDLDDQITDTFKKCHQEVIQARTGSHLTSLLKDSGDAIITTIINKFEAAVRKINKPLVSADIFVLIDEGHRTQYGSFHVSMQRVFPNACFIAFTGTPLMKKEKSTAQKFGGYIGLPYTVTDAVEDGAVVPLLYEGRHNNMRLDEDPLNRYFEKISKPLSETGKAALKRKFNTVGHLNRADKVIYARAWDISEHYVQFCQTEGDIAKPKAQLVAPTIAAAFLYKKFLDDIGMVTTAIIVSPTDQREGHEDGFEAPEEETARIEAHFAAMKDKYGDQKKYEKSIINQFKNRDHPEILIVVAKLLTGFDAPNNTVLYLCKSLKEHTLLQAIARVNRVAPGKEFGYIIDYYGNLEDLDKALTEYSGLEGFEPEDMEGLLTKVHEEVAKLPQAHADLWEIFREIQDRNVEPSVYEEHLRPEDIRHQFYERLSIFSKLLRLALASVHFAENTPQEKIDTYKRDAAFFLKLRVDVKRRFNDDLAYKEFEPKVQKLINQHLSTEGEILKVTEMVNIFNKAEREAEVEKLTGTAAQADHIATRTLKAINIRMEEDPVRYKKLADLIKETIEAYNQRRLEEAEYLNRIRQLEEQFDNGLSEGTPEELAHNQTAQVFFSLSKDAFPDPDLSEIAFHLRVAQITDTCIRSHVFLNGKKIIDWHLNQDILGAIHIELGDQLYELIQQIGQSADWSEIEAMVTAAVKVSSKRFQ